MRMQSSVQATDLRSTLAAVLSGTASPLAVLRFPIEQLAAACHAEGVATLIAQRVEHTGNAPEMVAALAQQRRRGQAASDLGQRAELRRVLATLGQAGIPVLLLKGHALGQWLYPEPHLRECSDIDLLFADRRQAEQAARAVQPLGYAVLYRPSRFAHEFPCRRDGWQIDLDLHWALAEAPALDRLPGFDALHASAIALPGLGLSAIGLSPVHALLHACVHRASNLGAGLGDRLKWLYDIHLLAMRFDSTEWDCFVDACRDARICGLAWSGLHAAQALFATGLPVAVSERLGRDAGADALDASRLADWRYLQRRNLQALDGFAAKACWLGNRVFPANGYLRELYGSEQGWIGLMWQRLLRLVARFTSRPDSASG